jgi:hypothetical protein
VFVKNSEPTTITVHEHEAAMPLFINNEEIEQSITMKDTMEALERFSIAKWAMAQR